VLGEGIHDVRGLKITAAGVSPPKKD
jgi:hypothetical protein